ncbi:MAG: DUF4270 family protein [Bacteroidales bacterium]|nr:DUF4270 family protein [Bacteroidales bacterium]
MIRYFSICIILLALLSCADQDAPFDIGTDKVEIKTSMQFTDTFTVHTYTVMMDSIKTSGLTDQQMVIGRYQDPEFGTITANAYFRVIMPSTSLDIDNDAVFDSLKLFMKYNGYYTGDTTQVFGIAAHRLNALLKPNTDGYFYNNDTISAFTDLFGYGSFYPRPNSSDTVWINLDPAFGSELFDLMKESDDRVTDEQDFLSYFRGMMLTYDTGNKAVLGFQFPSSNSPTLSKPTMRLYYHYPTGYSTLYKYFDFAPQSDDYDLMFNHFELHNPEVDFPDELSQKVPAASYAKGCTYVMSGIGLVTRVEIPYLQNLLSVYNNIKILDATLELEPLRNTYADIALPENLSLYNSNNRNHFLAGIANKYGDEQIATLQIDQLYQEETWYRFDVSGFLEAKLTEETDQVPAMLLCVTPDYLYKTVDRVIFGSQQHPENKVKLKVYYLIYE